MEELNIRVDERGEGKKDTERVDDEGGKPDVTGVIAASPLLRWTLVPISSSRHRADDWPGRW